MDFKGGNVWIRKIKSKWFYRLSNLVKLLVENVTVSKYVRINM